MQRNRLILLLVNITGGIAVLGSYGIGLRAHPALGPALWGGVPPQARPIYTATMLAAALGYFLFTFYFLFRLPPRTAALPLVSGLYLLVLAPSALWMPLTIRMLESPTPLVWVAIRGTLALVGLGALGLLASLLALKSGGRAWKLALAGCLAFCLQTAILDALVWPATFGV